jgi:hypothetical protein
MKASQKKNVEKYLSTFLTLAFFSYSMAKYLYQYKYLNALYSIHGSMVQPISANHGDRSRAPGPPRA